MIDILGLLHSQQLSLEDAENKVDEVLENFHNREDSPDWHAAIGLTKHELTAYAQGASLADLEKLRYGGWPTSCSSCGLPIDYQQFGWWFAKDENGQLQLKHIVCPEER